MKRNSSIHTGLTMLLLAVLVAAFTFSCRSRAEDKTVTTEEIVEQPPVKKDYAVKHVPTPNYDRQRANDVQGIILHHTAEPTVEKSLAILTSPAKKVGTHVVIDTDGTRYIMAEPTVATYHAGRSILNGREGCNHFTVGIEFQGNTLEAPLTEDQIASGIEYILPIMAKYNIPLENVVTHEMVRTAWMQRYPRKRCSGKVDITPEEYLRFMRALKPAWEAYHPEASE